MSEHQDTTFHSNPFRAMMNQLSMLLKHNPISTLTLGLLMLAVVFGGLLVLALLAMAIGNSAGAFISIVLGLVFFIVVVFRFSAASYTLQIASREGRSLTSRQALDEGAKKNYNKFVGTSIGTGLLILLGLIALVVPGVYLIGRLALAPYIAINEGLGFSEAVKRSWKLTKGHWFEVFAVSIASMIVISDGLLSMVGGQSGMAARYFELSHLEKSGAKAPEIHWMNYLLSVLAVIGIIGYIGFANSARNAKDTDDICDDNTYSILCSTTEDTSSSPSSTFERDFSDYYDSSPAN